MKERSAPSAAPCCIESNENMDFLKKNPYPLAAYCFGLYSVLQIFSTNGVVSTLNLLAYIFLTVMLFMKRRDILMVAAAAVPSVVSLLSIIIYGTNFLGFLSFLVGLTVPAYVACFLLPQLEPHVGKFMDTLKKFWFVPAAALGVLLVLRLVTGFFSAISLYGSYYFYGSFFDALSYTGMSFLSFLLNVLSIGGSLLLCCWMVWPDGLPEAWFSAAPSRAAAGAEDYQPAPGVRQQNADAIAASELEFSLVGHILLLLFVGAIWNFIWIYRTTKALNRVPGEEDRNPVTKLLLCMFVPFYHIYWIYKSCQRIDKLAGCRGVSSDISTLCLILMFIIGIVPPIIMQDKMNAIAATYASGRTNAPAAAPAAYIPAADADHSDLASYNSVPSRGAAYDMDTNTKEKETFGKAPAQLSAPADPQSAVPVYNAPAYDDVPVRDAELVQPADDVVEQLKKYKQLLDNGIITQEEFDAKKRQLLNL